MSELQRLVRELVGLDLDKERAEEIVNRFSFRNQSGRKPGQENIRSFLRKGIVGDWKNHFTSEARQVFNQHAGDALKMLGYESDDSWVQE